MPRPRKSSGHEPAWLVDPNQAAPLPPATRKLLRAALRDDDAKSALPERTITEALRAVEQVVAEYEPALEAQDRAPSAAAMRAELRAVHQSLERLDNAIDELSAVTKAFLQAQRPYDDAKLEAVIADTLIAIDAALRRLKPESRGAPRNRALESTIHQLSRIYRLYREPSIHPRRLRRKQLEFIAAALEGARIQRSADVRQLDRIVPRI